MKAYLTVDGKTVETECREKLLPWQTQGLSYTASGYGRAIPSRYVVRFNGRWRRVYVCQLGNAGTAYIGKPKTWLATVDHIDR